MQKKIVHVFNSSVISGPEMLTMPALPALGKLMDASIAVVLLIENRLGEQKAKAVIEYTQQFGYEVQVVQVESRADRGAVVKLAQTLVKLNPSVIHAHDVKASTYVLFAHRKQKGIDPNWKPLLVSTHHGTLARRGLTRVYEEIYVRFVLPYFDRTVVVCEADLASVAKRSRSKNVYVHLNGVDRNKVPQEARAEIQSQIRERWKTQWPELRVIADGAFWLGAVARLSWEKRHDRMLEMMALAQNQKSALLCFGVGEELDRLKQKTRELGLEKRVFWLGYSKTISQEIAGLDLLICLSDGEGIPVNLLEAGWSATPVFSTRVGGIVDLMKAPTADLRPALAFLVEKEWSEQKIATALDAALGDAEQLKKIGCAYQAHVEHNHSQSSWLNALVNVYRG